MRWTRSLDGFRTSSRHFRSSSANFPPVPARAPLETALDDVKQVLHEDAGLGQSSDGHAQRIRDASRERLEHAVHVLAEEVDKAAR